MKKIHSKKGTLDKRRPRRRRTGFTLIEVVASLGIIGLGIVGILALFPVAIDAGARATDRTAAALLGQYVIDQIRLHQNQIAASDDTAAALQTIGWEDYSDLKGNDYTFKVDDPDDPDTLPGADAYGSGEQIVKQLAHPENTYDANNPDDPNNGLSERHAYSRFEVALDFDEVRDEGGDKMGGFTSGGNKYLMQVTVTIRWPRAYSFEARLRQNTMSFVTYIRPQM
jgi:type II secretory pathway pseudopilin PulG